MSHSRSLTWAAGAALVLALLPTVGVRAIPPGQSVTLYEAVCGGWEGPDSRYWERGATAHGRDGYGFAIEYMLDGTAWVEEGTNLTHARIYNGVANGVVDLLVEFGTFQQRGSLGDYDGVFTWLWPRQDGHFEGQGVLDSTGTHIVGTLLTNDPIGLPAPPTDPCHGSPEIEHNYVYQTIY